MGIHSVYVLERSTLDVWENLAVDSTDVSLLMTKVAAVHVRRERHMVWIVSERAHLGHVLASSFPHMTFQRHCKLGYSILIEDGTVICRPVVSVPDCIAPLDRYVQNQTLHYYMANSPGASCRFVFASGSLSRPIRHPMDRVWHDDGAVVSLHSIQTPAPWTLCIEADVTPDPALGPAVRCVPANDPYVDRSRTCRATLMFEFDVSVPGMVTLTHHKDRSVLPDHVNPLALAVIVEEFYQECWRWFAKTVFDDRRMQFATANTQGNVVSRLATPPEYIYSEFRFLPSTQTRAMDRHYLAAPSLVVVSQ